MRRKQKVSTLLFCFGLGLLRCCTNFIYTLSLNILYSKKDTLFITIYYLLVNTEVKEEEKVPEEEKMDTSK